MELRINGVRINRYRPVIGDLKIKVHFWSVVLIMGLLPIALIASNVESNGAPSNHPFSE